MMIADRLRELRELKKLSQGEIERRTGMLRSYISRIENGVAVPSLESLEKIARGLDVPLYQLFYDVEESPEDLSHAKKISPIKHYSVVLEKIDST